MPSVRGMIRLKRLFKVKIETNRLIRKFRGYSEALQSIEPGGTEGSSPGNRAVVSPRSSKT